MSTIQYCCIIWNLCIFLPIVCMRLNKASCIRVQRPTVIYINRKSLSALSNCSMRIEVGTNARKSHNFHFSTKVTVVQLESCDFLAFDWPMFSHFTDIRMCYSSNTRPRFSVFPLTRLPLIVSNECFWNEQLQDVPKETVQYKCANNPKKQNSHTHTQNS